ncbi:hypothetical protein JWS13_03175 (plasmid) [Rhodococcus pseudokoreensis]|uniref:Uncharacterized protein n=1 Tax=Rhodococcus pseudokoreensis TaxID=2811421 RepID=A0A974VYZ9_9NOCA|nr:hypothetical protein [Rhodococcus pseudokoreensis]QSE87667.1 hypothetical protein JWS13_03175 [Rhodococcus pseudokoreensis]
MAVSETAQFPIEGTGSATPRHEDTASVARLLRSSAPNCPCSACAGRLTESVSAATDVVRIVGTGIGASLPLQPGGKEVYGISRADLPPVSALAVAAVTGSPATPESEPLLVPVQNAVW